jgi:hypothetical protein
MTASAASEHGPAGPETRVLLEDSQYGQQTYIGTYIFMRAIAVFRQRLNAQDPDIL